MVHLGSSIEKLAGGAKEIRAGVVIYVTMVEMDRTAFSWIIIDFSLFA